MQTKLWILASFLRTSAAFLGASALTICLSFYGRCAAAATYR